MMRMPRRMRTAMPPITAPAMRPGEGLEDLDEVAGADEDEDVDWEVVWEASDVVADAIDESVVGVGVGVDIGAGVGVPALLLALGVGASSCEVKLGSGATLGRRMLGIAVGIATTVWLDRKDATTPPTLFKMLFI